MTFVFETPHLGMPPITDHGPATLGAGLKRPWKLGDIVRAVDPVYGVGEFIYLQGLAATALGTWVVYNPDDWSTTLLVSGGGLIGSVAVAMAPTVASEYGWYQISGKAIALALASYADNGLVYATATAGSVDDAVIAGARRRLADLVHLGRDGREVGHAPRGVGGEVAPLEVRLALDRA